MEPKDPPKSLRGLSGKLVFVSATGYLAMRRHSVVEPLRPNLPLDRPILGFCRSHSETRANKASPGSQTGRGTKMQVK
jgi:hypothetical protein